MDLIHEIKHDVANTVPLIGVEAHMLLPSGFKDEQFSRTAECAYYKAEARGFEPGHEMEDWLEAEAEENK